MRKLVPLIALLASATALPTHAAQGEVCTSEAKAPTAQQPVYPLTNELKFTCPSLGEVTVPEIYQKGWRVVQTWAAGAPKPDGAPAGAMPYIHYVTTIEKI